MKKCLASAAVIAGITGFAAFRTVGILRMDEAPDAAVKCGKYYLDNGQKNAYIEVISTDDESRSFVMSIHNYDLTEMAEHTLSYYGKVNIGEVICDENGKPIRHENGGFALVGTEEQRAELQRKKEAEIQQITGEFLSRTEHGFVLRNDDYDEVLEWYQYSLKGCGDYFSLRVSPKKDVINFDDYIWKYGK